ncbi:MAG: hypothetical protein ACI4LX_06275 [Treponema sp.]
MKKKTKSRLSSVIFILICILICFISLYAFVVDFNRTSVRNEQEIATIYFKRKIAQRKFSDSVVWERLQQNSLLYNEDIIRTDSGSSAVMNFLNGASIDLGEHTMIQIFQSKDGEVSLQVSGGNIVVDTKEAKGGIKVDLGNNIVINLEKGSLLSTDVREQSAAFVIQEGSGSIVNSDGNEDVIFAGETIRIDETGEPKKLPVSIVNLTHNQRLLFFENEEKKVEVKFKTYNLTDGQKIILESSYDRDFSDIAERLETTPSESEDAVNGMTLSVSTGTVYYRLYPEDDILSAAEGNLLIEETSAPVLVSPVKDCLFELEDFTSRILFSWKTDDYTDFSRIEIYDENDVNTPIFSGDVYENSFVFSKFHDGNFLWKIIPHYAANKNEFGVPSHIQKFNVTKKQKSDSPVLLFPANNSKLTLDVKESSVLFAWKSDVKNSVYDFEISKDRNFESVIYNSKENNTRKSFSCSISMLPEGKYFWRVARSDVQENESGDGEVKGESFYSNVQSFDVEKYLPEITSLVYPPDNFVVEKDKLKFTNFTWKVAGDLKNDETECLLQFSQSENYADESPLENFAEGNVIEFETLSSEYKGIKLDSGNYFWQIKVVDKNTKAELAKTDFRKLCVVNQLESPEFIFPRNDSEYAMTPEALLKLEYSRVAEADFYKVKVFNAVTNELIAKVDSTDSSSLEIQLPYYDDTVKQDEELVLKCSVSAFAMEKENSPMRVSQSSDISFKLTYAKNVVLNFPENGARISGLAAVRNPVRFRWTEDNAVYKKEFVLTKKMSNGTSRVVSSIQNPKNGIELSRLSPGDYTWTINAETKSGTSLSASRKFNFTILPVEMRESVKLISPENEFVIGPDYLKNNRRIVFEWQKDSEATDYVFALYQQNENGTLRRIVSEKVRNSRFVFSDLAKLDVGTFEWHVTSYIHASDGFEEQKSDDAKAIFKISFDLPDTVKIIEPGRMYGN